MTEQQKVQRYDIEISIRHASDDYIPIWRRTELHAELAALIRKYKITEIVARDPTTEAAVMDEIQSKFATLLRGYMVAEKEERKLIDVFNTEVQPFFEEKTKMTSSSTVEVSIDPPKKVRCAKQKCKSHNRYVELVELSGLGAVGTIDRKADATTNEEVGRIIRDYMLKRGIRHLAAVRCTLEGDCLRCFSSEHRGCFQKRAGVFDEISSYEDGSFTAQIYIGVGNSAQQDSIVEEVRSLLDEYNIGAFHVCTDCVFSPKANPHESPKFNACPARNDGGKHEPFKPNKEEYYLFFLELPDNFSLEVRCCKLCGQVYWEPKKRIQKEVGEND